MGRIRLFGISRWICAPAIAVVLGASTCSLVGNAPGRSEVSGQGAVADRGGVDQAKPRRQGYAALKATARNQGGQGWHGPTPLPMPSDGAADLKSVPLTSLAVTPSKRPTGRVDPTLPWLRSDSAGRIIQANLTRSAAAPRTPPIPPKPAVAVHLASYGSRAAARSGWDTLRKMYPRVLAAAEPILMDAEAGAKGPAVRLLAGPFDSESAGSVCRDILARGGWCRQVPLPD
jgi:hypothetical protein